LVHLFITYKKHGQTDWVIPMYTT